MAISLQKKNQESQYYYSDGTNTFGPMNVVQLIEKIKPETMVYREGMDWTIAKNVDELKKFFPAEKIVEKVVIEEKVKVIREPNPNPVFTQTQQENLPGIYRSSDSKVIFGFCGGLAHKFNVNVIFIRILVFFSIYFFIGWLYFLTFLLPAVSTKNR
jgi:phage shock protein PspC (stress-responsive transcriptional regulator)